MTALSDLKSKMKGKVKLSNLSDNASSDVETSSHSDLSPNKQDTSSTGLQGDLSPSGQAKAIKARLTVYLDSETESLFNQMYASKIVKGEKVDKSSIVSQAIKLLHKSFDSTQL